MSPRISDQGPIGLEPDAVTLVEGSSFAIAAHSGDLSPDRPHGVFVQGTRILSRWDLRVDGRPVQPLAALTPEPYRATFVGYAPGHPEGTLLVRRDRWIGAGLREDIVLRNHGPEPLRCLLSLQVSSDLAGVFAVREGKPHSRRDPAALIDGDRLTLVHRGRGVVVEAVGAAAVERDEITYRPLVPAGGEWRATVLVRPVVDRAGLPDPYPASAPAEEGEPARRFRSWLAGTPTANTGQQTLDTTLRISRTDLGALRITDPEDPGTVALAAGAPWYMTLFGRDALLSSWLALPLDPSLALGSLRMLARYQGTESNLISEEQPGKIPHELRTELDPPVYYGSADATPLFVALLGELHRWGEDPAELEKLLPHADRALAWIRDYGDRDGDGFVEYQRTNEHGLVNQGWKDSPESVNFADGRLAEAPIALCEVQGYVYAAYRARARLAAATGDAGTAEECTRLAAELKRAFNERFWLPDRGWFALALDRDKEPVDACASNLGHCLWSGIVDRDKAAAVARRLVGPQMFTGWGVRTLAADMGRYDPASYHNGSVWPHDSAIVAAGLMRYGFVAEARRVALGVLAAADAFAGRLPELFCGVDRREVGEPVPYPTSCSPQAWAAATPVSLLRTLLRLEPDVPNGVVRLAPALPPALRRLSVVGVPLAGHRVDLRIRDDELTVSGLPDWMRLETKAEVPD